jgi:hypothetical protein
MAAAVAVADILAANATRGSVRTCQCCMHAVDVAVPTVDCPKSCAVPMSRTRRVHNSSQMRCREAQEVSMRIVGDTTCPTVCCVTCQKSVSRHSKRRAGMSERECSPERLACRPASHQIAIVRPRHAQRLHRRQRKRKAFLCRQTIHGADSDVSRAMAVNKLQQPCMAC